MKTLYLDIFSGMSGDMFTGAMLDLGVRVEDLERELEKLGLHEYHLHISRGHKASIEGVKFDVHVEHDHDHEHAHAHEPSHDHDHGHEHKHDDGHHHHHGEAEDEHGEHGHHHHTHTHTHSHPHSHGDVTHTHEHAHEHEHEHEHEHGRNFRQIQDLIKGSRLSPWVKEKAVAVFARIARAEGKIHGMPAAEVHFHEVGAVDSIVDIVGACICLELLGKPRVLAATVTEGTGFVTCAHGRFPIPAPATMNILAERGVPISQCEERGELVTPTGAAILAEFVEEFGPMRDLAPEKAGFGLGTRDNKTRPNVLRAVLGSTTRQGSSGLDWESDRVTVLETNIDDLNPEILGHFGERCLGAGALDAFHTAVQMKKNRPGILFTLLVNEGDADRFSEMVLRETTALGVRRYTAERRKLRREIRKFSTPYGEIAVKVGLLNGKAVQASPEFEACKAAAERSGVPIKTIYEAAVGAWQAEVNHD